MSFELFITLFVALGIAYFVQRERRILREKEEVQKQDTWPEVEVQKKVNWPNEAVKTGELEPGEYTWCRSDKLGEDGGEVVKKIDMQQRKVLLYKHGNSLTLVKKDPKQKKK